MPLAAAAAATPARHPPPRTSRPVHLRTTSTRLRQREALRTIHQRRTWARTIRNPSLRRRTRASRSNHTPLRLTNTLLRLPRANLTTTPRTAMCHLHPPVDLRRMVSNPATVPRQASSISSISNRSTEATTRQHMVVVLPKAPSPEDTPAKLPTAPTLLSRHPAMATTIEWRLD